MSGRQPSSLFNARAVSGPRPMKFGKATQPIPTSGTSAPISGTSWWIGLSREQFDAELAKRDRTLGGDFRHESGYGGYAPDAYSPPRRKRVTAI